MDAKDKLIGKWFYDYTKNCPKKVLYAERQFYRVNNPAVEYDEIMSGEMIRIFLGMSAIEVKAFNKVVIYTYDTKTQKENSRHTIACQRYQAEGAFKTYAYEQQHPGYCKRCSGTGAVEHSYDPSPAGVCLASGYMTDLEWCPKCTGHEPGTCPQCGNRMTWTSDWSGSCHCGYKIDDLPIDGTFEKAPQYSDCYCYEFLYDGEE